MGKIAVLPDVLASQVAAGEVVERPASVIKELVENSLDAGATQVEVCVDRGGVALMRVTDDGCGMSREDALLCLERHATSKLRTSEDLFRIRTLGFRGEALPSIASVSRFTVATREAAALAGTEVIVDGGKVLEVRDWGGAPGTVMEVRNLFWNVPARRKFLRSENTEHGHVEQVVRVQALAHPEVGFTLLRDGRVVFQLPARGSLRSRIEGLAGADVAGRLLERTEAERGGLRVRGWIGAPGCSRADRTLTLVFVNGRPVENPALSYALRTAYGDSLARGQHPVCFLFIDMDPAAADVNVHPAKKEVRFRDGLGVQAALASLLQETLRGGARSAVRPLEEEEEATVDAVPQDVVRETPPPVVTQRQAVPQAASAASATPAAPVEAAPVFRLANPPVQQALGLKVAAKEQEKEEDVREERRPDFRFIGLLETTYALLQSPEGLVLMHLRAAHERVLYEAFRTQAAQQGGALSQPLLVPQTLPLTPRDFALVRDHLPLLRKLGFGIEEFGANTVMLDAMPALLRGEPGSAFFSELLDELAHGGEAGARARMDLDALAAVVSTRAVPQSAVHTQAQVEALLTQLMACDMPYCDPAGRPTLIQLSFQELARKFSRRM